MLQEVPPPTQAHYDQRKKPPDGVSEEDHGRLSQAAAMFAEQLALSMPLSDKEKKDRYDKAHGVKVDPKTRSAKPLDDRHAFTRVVTVRQAQHANIKDFANIVNDVIAGKAEITPEGPLRRMRHKHTEHTYEWLEKMDIKSKRAMKARLRRERRIERKQRSVLLAGIASLVNGLSSQANTVNATPTNTVSGEPKNETPSTPGKNGCDSKKKRRPLRSYLIAV